MIDFHHYLRLFRHWAWLVGVAALLCGAAVYFIRTNQTPVYRASTKLLIGGFLQTPNPDATQISTSISLVKTYAELVKSYAVLQSTVDVYNLPVSPEQLSDLTQVVARDETAFLEIAVTYHDPELVMHMANGLAEQLILLKSPAALLDDQQNQLDFLDAEIVALNTQLLEIRTRLAEINTLLQTPIPFNEVNQLTQERLTLTTQSIQITSTLEQLSSTVASLRQQANSLEVVDRARLPTAPVGVNKWIVTILGAMIGALAGVGAIILFDELQRPVKASQGFEVPVVGSIPRSKGQPAAFRLLQASLMVGQKPTTYIVTSPQHRTGTSTIAVHLAMTMAQTGLKVLLVDANLLQPALHKQFKVEKTDGLSQALADETTEIETLLRPTSIENLALLPAGEVAPHLAFRLYHWRVWAERLQPHFEVIIFDTPPCLLSGESLLLADALPAHLLLVLEVGKTSQANAHAALQKFTLIEHKSLVLNKL